MKSHTAIFTLIDCGQISKRTRGLVNSFLRMTVPHGENWVKRESSGTRPRRSDLSASNARRTPALMLPSPIARSFMCWSGVNMMQNARMRGRPNFVDGSFTLGPQNALVGLRIITVSPRYLTRVH
jgi:hypothetical protein